MERNGSADRFADCVIRRTSWDTFVRPGVLIAAMVVPAFIGLLIVALVLDRYAGEALTEDGVSMGIFSAVVIELAVISFLLYKTASRTHAHQRRDDIWADALVGYVRSKGGDVSRLSELADRIHGRGRAALVGLSGLMCGFVILYTAALAFYVASGGDLRGNTVYALAAFAYLVVILQFLLTTGATYGFPLAHERAQIAFTEELSKRLSSVGVEMPPMERSVGRTWWPVCIFLFLITAGLFSLVMFIMACRSMNHHLSNQWEYEMELLDRIIGSEGGKGVRPVEGEEAGGVRRILRSLF